MPRQYQERRIYQRPQAEVRQAAERAIYELGMEPKPHNQEWVVEAGRSMSTFSWGERIQATMATSPGGGTQVIVESRLVFGFMDWGRNAKNVAAMFESMETLLGPGQAATLPT